MSTAVILLIITNGIWGLAAIAAIWALLHFGKVRVSSPAKTGASAVTAAKETGS